MFACRQFLFSAYHWMVPEEIRPRSMALKRLQKQSQGRILGGPFRGMKYLDQSVGSVLLAKILGTYELELHSVIERICQSEYDLIIDVGAAEGYYAVGLAMRCRNSRVVAFEMEATGRDLLAQLAASNNVSKRIHIEGICTLDALTQALALLGTH